MRLSRQPGATTCLGLSGLGLAEVCGGLAFIGAFRCSGGGAGCRIAALGQALFPPMKANVKWWKMKWAAYRLPKGVRLYTF